MFAQAMKLSPGGAAIRTKHSPRASRATNLTQRVWVLLPYLGVTLLPLVLAAQINDSHVALWHRDSEFTCLLGCFSWLPASLEAQGCTLSHPTLLHFMQNRSQAVCSHKVLTQTSQQGIYSTCSHIIAF